MATHYNPKIITNNIEFSVDAANVKSWSGASSAGTAYGYYGGGYSSAVSTVDRIDYGNDTATASTKGPLSSAKGYLSATSSTSYGYWGGGYSDSLQSAVDRLDYSNDTPTMAAKGPLATARFKLDATGNNSYGYFAGGRNPSGPTVYSTVERVDYSNDTATAAAKGPLSVARYGLFSTGNQSYGYWGGGGPSPLSSLVDRLDYSSDTTTAAAKGPLSDARHLGSATGNASYGYFGGGTPGPGYMTTVDRVDYSSDTPTMTVKGSLATSRTDFGATGNTSYGYFAGGTGGGTTIDRIDYSSDTPTATAKGNLSSAPNKTGGRATSSRDYANPTTESIWKDMTGHGDITVDGPTFSGLNGGVWDFDGSNDYMEKTSFSGVAFGTGDFAVETWVRVDNLTLNHMIFESRSAASSTEDGFVFFVYGTNQDEWVVWTAGAAKISGANGSFAADTWYHTIVTRISGTTTLYVNGVSIGSFSDSYNYSNDDLRIGKNVSSADYLNGKIALYRIYKARGFTASEVLNNFNATRTRFGV